MFGLLNGAWAGATVLMPLAAGALAEHAGPRAGYLAVIVPGLLIAGLLSAGLAPLHSRERSRELPRARRRFLVGRAGV